MTAPGSRPARRLLRLARAALALAAAVLCPVGAARAQVPDADGVYQHVKKAQALAGADLQRFFYRRCLVEPAYPRTIASTNQAPAPMEPVKVMDRLYFLGQNAVSAWALDTSEGFVIFDALNDPGEAQQYIEAGLRTLGQDPARIKYIVVTHEHGDHFGGSTYLKDSFGGRIIASTIGWDEMAKPVAPPPPRQGTTESAPVSPAARWARLVPKRDVEIADGQRVTIGDTTLTFYVTPGHARGVVSTIFTATDRGATHVVALHGGLGAIREPAMRDVHIKALKRWRAIAAGAGVDTLIGNHQTQDGAVENLELLKLRRDGDPNPFVLGSEGYLRYIDINLECTYANMARSGQKLE